MNRPERLAAIPLFAGLSTDDLERLCLGARDVVVEKGEQLFAEGDPGEEAFVITAGEIEIIKHNAGREVLLAVRREGEVIGEVSLLEEAPRMATARARTAATAIAIPRQQLDDLLDSSPTAGRAMFSVLLARFRETEARLRQSERMAQLGTLTAGLAHELNNPASAVQRAASDLRAATETYAAARAGFDAQLPTGLGALLARAVDPTTRPRLDPISRSDAEATLEAWLTKAGIAEPWQVAPALVTAGVAVADLTVFAADQLTRVVALLVAGSNAHELLFQIVEGSTRVFEIVKALKSYSFLDQAPVQEVDVVRGIEDTLLIMRTKIGDIAISRGYAEIPRIPAYGSELNQVWTNLIDNAVDAIHGSNGSTITIRTRVDGGSVIIEVEDDGPGIPPETLPRIFDSFFTTKAPGAGTGLGLDISYGIVVNRHGGEITVDTEPGRTTFRVAIPIAGPPA